MKYFSFLAFFLFFISFQAVFAESYFPGGSSGRRPFQEVRNPKYDTSKNRFVPVPQQDPWYIQVPNIPTTQQSGPMGPGVFTPGAGMNTPGAGINTPGAGMQDINLSQSFPYSFSNIGELATKLANFLFLLAAPLVIITILYGSFVLIFAGAIPANISKGWSIIRYAVLGYVIIVVARLIVSFITTFFATANYLS
ncbi:MAG: hypothetical protein FJY91_00080 [Candidatus Harrisonbacteria bacterium]|nr:hypothetical protein [Candidatus Harrisonbacteria bacterium]